MKKIENINKIVVVFYPILPAVATIIMAIMSGVFFWGRGFFLSTTLYYTVCGALFALEIACMIYVWILLTNMSSDINKLCKDDGEHSIPWICAVLLGFVTAGVYYMYYLYKIQNRLQAQAQKKGIVIKESGNTILLWFLLKLQTLGLCKIIILNIIVESFNKLVDDKKVIPPKPVGSVVAKIECISGAMKGAVINLSGGNTVVIGREAQYANFVIDDKKETNISRRHCSIRCDANGKIYITDHSRNGTYISNKGRIPKDIEMQIERGSIIQLSETTRLRIS